MTEAGSPAPLGATPRDDGVNFALYSSGAERIELCQFDADDREIRRIELVARSGDVWHIFVPGCGPGQAYGYRVHGPYRPTEGLRYNAGKLLIDPYARMLRGEFVWAEAVFDFEPHTARDEMRINAANSAQYVPKCVVVDELPARTDSPLRVPWSETIIYETNVRGYTMRHPGVSEADRGLFRGMRNGQILDHLRSLGITSIELMPVQAFIDEQFLQKRGLRNFWGYNTIGFFAPAQRYLGTDRVDAFREMVDAIHDAGIEVILDVAYNHTAESDRFGPTLSFRGIDNLGYYRTAPDDPGEYVNYTGCGNTINTDHAVVRNLVIDSLRYWAEIMGVDGFRFDLATVLGRSEEGFTREHPLLEAIGTDPVLRSVKLIAEPWDIGPGGYQLGNFPPSWAEWNDRFRDTIRRFWRGDDGQSDDFEQRLTGSQDVFGSNGLSAKPSINFVASHDGFTLADLVSYESRHNEANREDNRDGHPHNFSCNNGTEGDTEDQDILALRRRQRLNLLGTLVLSRGTPMLLAGDEFGNSQKGNNNAYAQDNDIGWIDWAGADHDPDFLEQCRSLIKLRRQDLAWLKRDHIEHRADVRDNAGIIEYRIKHADAGTMIVLLINASLSAIELPLPECHQDAEWRVVFSTAGNLPEQQDNHSWRMPGRSLACIQLKAC
jgi:isoamylase